MKKNLLFLLVLAALSLTMNAQNIVFEDDFESYADATNLATAGYVVWEGTASVVDVDVQTGESPAYSGHKYAKCIVENGHHNFYLRKELTLEEGKTYIFEAVTRSPAGKNHKIAIKVGDRSVASSLVNHTDWNKVSVEVTIAAGETSAVAYVYSWPESRVDVDDFKVYEKGSATRISKNKVESFKVFPNPSKGLFTLSGENTINEYVVYNSAGQAVKDVSSIDNLQTTVNLSGLPKGLYMIKVIDKKGDNHIVKTLVK